MGIKDLNPALSNIVKTLSQYKVNMPDLFVLLVFPSGNKIFIWTFKPIMPIITLYAVWILAPTMNWERLTLAFRVSAYRWVWASNFAAAAGFQPFMIGQGWLLYDLTGSPFMVGLAPGLGAAFNLVLSPFWGFQLQGGCWDPYPQLDWLINVWSRIVQL